MDWLYAKHIYCFLKNGKAVRKLKKQMNRRWRRELNEEMLEELKPDSWEYMDYTFSKSYRDNEELYFRGECNIETYSV